jgi:hypothetical protein
MEYVIAVIFIALIFGVSWYLNTGNPTEHTVKTVFCDVPECKGTKTVTKILRSPIGYQYEVSKCTKCGAVKGTNFRSVK